MLDEKDPRMSVSDISCYALRTPAEERSSGQPAILTKDDVQDSAFGPDKYILCRQCSQIISTKDEEISVDGSHYHTFANPHGMVFDIRCFRAVSACSYTGPPSDEFTWFEGYCWRITLCSMCLTHLGWLFMSGGGHSFHGLIRDRIVETSGN
jgi:hypothetical protein